MQRMHIAVNKYHSSHVFLCNLVLITCDIWHKISLEMTENEVKMRIPQKYFEESEPCNS